MKGSYYNTNRLAGQQLSIAELRAINQEELVETIFKSNPTVHFSPSQIQKLAALKYQKHSPLTSWRRAITNLTKDGLLEKTEVIDRRGFWLRYTHMDFKKEIKKALCY